jgi:multiple sugar transport system permease protein
LGVDTSVWYSNVLDIGRLGDALYAFPKGFSPIMMFYNRTLFRRAGISEPEPGWTWDEYLSLAKIFTVDEDGDGTPEQYGTGMSNRFYYWIPWVWTGGGDVVSPDGDSATGYLNSPRTVASLRFLIDLVRVHGVAPDLGSWVQGEKTGITTALFANGNLAMVMDGHWRMPSLLRYMRQGVLDVGVVSLPIHPSGRKVNVMYESGWCVPINAPHPREAALLAAFLAGEKASRIRSRQWLEIPSVKAVAEENVQNDPSGMEQAFVDEIPYCRQPWGSVIERFSQIEWTLQDAVDEVLVSGKPIGETMTAYAQRIDRELATIRKHQDFAFRPIGEHSEILLFLVAVSGAVLAFCLILYRRARGKERASTGTAFSFLAPSLLHLTVFIVTPIAFSAYLSLHQWDIVVPDKPFVGLANFGEIVQDALFWNALGNTLLFTLNVPLGMAFALGVALLLNHRMRAVGLLRTIYFLPSVTSFVAIALVWMWIYHPTFGLANFLLSIAGLPTLQWLNSASTAMVSVMIFTIWLGLGYQMVVYLAGLQGIPEDLYEAARIDGASAWQRFWRVTLPLLKPTTFFILVTSFIASFQVFTSIYVMTAGGPTRSTDVLVYHIYQAAWEQLRMGYASAMSWVLFVIIMIATAIQFRLMGKAVEYG